MKQLDLYDESFNGTSDSDIAKIYESPDKGKTVYERDFGAHPSTRKIIKTAVQQQWNITFNGVSVNEEDCRRIPL